LFFKVSEKQAVVSFNLLFYTWNFENDFKKLKLADFTIQSQINQLNRSFNQLFFVKHNKFCFNCQNCFGLMCICFGLCLTEPNDYFCGFKIDFYISKRRESDYRNEFQNFSKRLQDCYMLCLGQKSEIGVVFFLHVSGVTFPIHSCISVYV